MDASKPLAGRVALVAGATRGAGRALAVELARAGAYVYATGRSSRVTGRSEIGRPETIEETGDLRQAAGDRIVKGLTAELAGHALTAVGVTPGWLRSENMLEHYGVTEATWRDALVKVPFRHLGVADLSGPWRRRFGG